jgi:CHAT domain-containing protein/tetratricopeptide (TPR) repeat protein
MPERLFPDDPVAERAYQEGETLLRQGQWGEALASHERLLTHRLLKRQALTVGDRVLAEQVADLSVPFGRIVGADSLLHGLVESNRSAGFAFAADYLTVKRLDLALARSPHRPSPELVGELEKRIGPLNDIPWEAALLPAWEENIGWNGASSSPVDRDAYFACLYLQLGKRLAAQGQYGHAAVLLERGSQRAGPTTSALARRAYRPLQLSYAAVLLEQGRFPECRAVLDALDGSFDSCMDPGWLVQWLELMGQWELLQGQFGPALSRFEQVSGLCAERGFHRATAGALMNQAEVLILVNQIDAAEELLAEARLLADLLDDPHLRHAIEWLARLARSRAHSLIEGIALAPSVTELWGGATRATTSNGADTASAAPGSADEKEVFSQPANWMAFFERRALEVQQSLAAGDLLLARQQLATMRECFQDVESPRIVLRLHALTGMTHYACGDFSHAAPCLDEVIPHIERLGMKLELWQVLRFRGWCAARLNAPEQEQQQWLDRTWQVMTELAGSFPAEQRAVYLLNKWTVEEKHLAAELETLRQEKIAVQGMMWPLRIWRVGQLRSRVLGFLTAVDADRRRLAERELLADGDAGTNSPSSLRAWLRSHRPDTAVVSYLVLPDRLFVACSHRGGLDFAIRPVTRLEIRAMVRRWHELTRRWDEWDVPDLEQHASELADALGWLEVLPSLPRRVKRLTIVADDALHGLPFAALRCGGRYLVEDYAVTMAYDRTKMRPMQTKAGNKALAVGVSRGSGALQPRVEPLPGVVDETECFRQTWSARGWNVRMLMDEQAQRSEVLAALPQVRLAHFACHGTFSPDGPDRSGLVLIPGPDTIEVLSLRDVASLDLRGLDHVSLSSCWGADNFVHPGRWIVSLPETICRRGAGSVLASLWPIADDRVGVDFAASFFQHLGHLPRDLALQQTQLASLRNGNHPCCWAGYRLHGTPEPLG